MRYLLTALLALAVLGCLTPVNAQDFTIFVNCVERPGGGGSDRAWFGYESGSTFTPETPMLLLGGSGLINNLPGVLAAGRHDRVFGVDLDAAAPVEWTIYHNGVYTTVSTADNIPTCGENRAAAGPDGGLTTITLWDVAGTRFTWEIRDQWDNWHGISGVETPVEFDQGRPFTRLVLGPDNGNHDPANYRVTAKGE